MEMLEAILLIWRSLRQIKGHGRSIIIEATRMSDANYHYSCNIIEMRTEYGCGLVASELLEYSSRESTKNCPSSFG